MSAGEWRAPTPRKRRGPHVCVAHTVIARYDTAVSYARLKKHRVRRRAAAIAYLGGACANCGETAHLQFDHIDPNSKSIEISNAIVNQWAWPRLVAEMRKCQLLCRRHHAEKTSLEARARVTHGRYHAAYHLGCSCQLCDEFKIAYRIKITLARGRTPRPPPRHGTYAMYKREGRGGLETCAACRAANVEYTQVLRERRRGHRDPGTARTRSART